MEAKMKLRTMTVFFALLLGLTVMFLGTETSFAAIQQENGVYQIKSYEDLKEFADIVNGTHATIEQDTAACAILSNNIQAPNGAEWTPIGSESAPYTGTFDGQEYEIRGLKTTVASNSYVGLFGHIGSGSVVKNVGLDGNSIYGYKYTGGIAGHNDGGTIENCYNKGSVSGGDGAYPLGGIVGLNTGGTIESCYNTGSVSAGNSIEGVGGIAGYNDGGTIENCYNKGSVSGGDSGYYVGGVAGYNGGTVENCYNDGNVDGDIRIGGIAGQNRGNVKNCHNTGSISGTDEDIGGIAGKCTAGEISCCYNTGEITATNTSGESDAGGIVGELDGGKVSNCYNTGSISGNIEVGGVAGEVEEGTVSNCYSTGVISGSDQVGGVVGDNESAGDVKNCFYDKDKAGVTEAIGRKGGTITNVEGFTTEELTGKACTTYDSWENFFAIWRLTDDYPVIDPHSHQMTYSDAKKESCEEGGHVAGYTCSVCGKHYSDDAGLALIPDADWATAPAIGHKYGPWTKLNGTQHQKVCEHDKSHVVNENHKWDGGKVTKKATEKATGTKTYTCTVCKATKTETIPKLKPSAPKVSGTPLAKMTAKGSDGLVIAWNRIQGVDGYDIFFAECDHGGKTYISKHVKTVKGNNTFSWTKTGLKKRTSYKAYVKAYVMQKGKKKYVKMTPLMHAFTSGGSQNYTNAKGITVERPSVTLRKGKSYGIKAKIVKIDSSKILVSKNHAPTFRFTSSNEKVATVSDKGGITAKGKGTCNIYVYAHNGVSRQVKVTVR